MSKLMTSGLFFLAAGCVATVSELDLPVLTDFSEIDQSLGKEVAVRGFISLTHEATGLYLRERDLLEANERCIVPQPFEGFSHGEEVTLSGRLQRTDCGVELICTNGCSRYVLIRD